MANIQDFVDHVQKEYVEGSEDRKKHVGELIPDVIDTEDAISFFLTEAQTQLPGMSSAAPTLNFTDWSFWQYCKRLSPHDAKLDAGYVKACSPRLALRQLQFWSKVFQERETYLRLHIDPDNGNTTIRAALTGMYRKIDAMDVANKLQPMLQNKDIEFSVTPKRWHIGYWESAIAYGADMNFDVGFRVLGSEVGALKAVRIDTLLGFKTDRGQVVLPILKDGKPLARLPHTNAGPGELAKIQASTQLGLQRAESAKTAIGARLQEVLKYPQDEFHDIVLLHRLPNQLQGLPIESPQRFENIKTKFDMACLLGQLASESTGKTQLSLEKSAGLYLITGRAKQIRNRNYED